MTSHSSILSSALRRPIAIGGVVGIAALLVAATTLTWSLDLPLIGNLHAPVVPAHQSQTDFVSLVQGGRGRTAFEKAFAQGDRIFDSAFNALDGGGANVGQGQRYTRIPRADLTGPGEWAQHVPSRATGPNAQSCAECHATPAADGSGGIAANVTRDPTHSGNLSQMIHRSTPHMFGAGALQRLAEEMTTELQAQRDALVVRVRQTQALATVALTAKGVSFGMLRGSPAPAGAATTTPGVVLDTTQVQGVSADLVVRPFQWKGSVGFLRDFNRGAAHNEIGMQAVELVGEGVDGDGDNVANELTVGDITALTIYVAAQPRPVSKLELDSLGLLGNVLTWTQIQQINHGKLLFTQIGCAACHVPALPLNDSVFREPSAHPSYRDTRFPSGALPRLAGVRADLPVSFDLAADQPQNVFTVGGQVVRLGSFRRQSNGTGAVIELYGDLKRHDMGPDLAESIDENGAGASTFLTENLWGVGSTAPYLHDGRATTLTEAILWHGGEAAASRSAFRALTTQEQLDLLLFLSNLTLLKGGLPIGN